MNDGSILPWPHPIQAVAFDMDGLMVNTEDLYTEVGQELLQQRGSQFTPELKNQMMGLPGEQAFQVMIDYANLTDSVDTLARESEEIFAGLLPGRLQVLPGILALLEELEARRVARCVATSSTHEFAATVLEQVHLRERVEFVITAQDVDQGKPAPDIYLAAARQMNVLPENMLVLEDSHHGSRAGIAAGACTIAIPGAHSAEHDFTGVYHQAPNAGDPIILELLG